LKSVKGGEKRCELHAQCIREDLDSEPDKFGNAIKVYFLV